MIELAPLRTLPEYFEPIERELIEHLRREIYIPILEELGEEDRIENSMLPVSPKQYDALIEAISKGRVWFAKGRFEGKFSSSISKALKGLGASWDRTQGCWKIPHSKLPYDLKTAVAVSQKRFTEAMQKIGKKLEALAPEEIADRLKLDKILDGAMHRINKDFNATTKKLQIEAKFTDAQKKRMVEQYTENMKLSIKGWAEEEIVALRKRVQKHEFSGGRYEGMIKTIQDSYGVSRSKARFLARQETNLLMSSYRRNRYLDAGIKEYRWECVAGSPNHPVRPMHKRLDGKVFNWDTPPIVNDKGDRKHPGEDFGCRCVARPIVRF